MREIDEPDVCPKCNGKNKMFDSLDVAGHMTECRTKCQECGYEGFWFAGSYANDEDLKEQGGDL